ncbi:DUF803 domain membrane protein [Paracoccidioides lutzii Pb01]|uniref:DUF803 domain membrane protein n=1 Tax=Paracoccidioides lutzii (strain ATCC MYA-826 / Pb01) TaxID=502779 RepID=C1H1U1_PARBA|nr:DUF803 domain membrane protein [Paracoccidioides lutzii Pb01]EEH33828.2 DUF803 domain membrane protein [Paracoccidioides lutzii Pb01]
MKPRRNPPPTLQGWAVLSSEQQQLPSSNGSTLYIVVFILALPTAFIIRSFEKQYRLTRTPLFTISNYPRLPANGWVEIAVVIVAISSLANLDIADVTNAKLSLGKGVKRSRHSPGGKTGLLLEKKLEKDSRGTVDISCLSVQVPLVPSPQVLNIRKGARCLLFRVAFSKPLSPPAINIFRSGNSGNDGGDNAGDGSGNGGGDAIREWSSTIGIVTAIIGNILISFALNIQRYAHIRIEREYDRSRQRNGWKRTVSRTGQTETLSSSNYDMLTNGAEGEVTDVQGHMDASPADTNGRRHRNSEEISRLGFRQYTDEEDGGGMSNSLDDGNQRPDTLQQSFISDRTLTPMEKSQISNERKSYLKSPYWWAGIILMTIGEAGNFLAYGFAPASIVSPLGVVALISNCIIAPFMLKETFRRRDLLGVLVAVAGAVTIVFSAKTSETKIGPDEIWDMITTWEFELYLGVTVALILALMCASQRYGRKSILIDLGLVGLFGGYTALSTKGVASLLSFTLWHVITFPITYALVAVLAFSALMQIRYINRALQRFDSTQVIPTQFVLFTISVIVGSAVLYRDFESTSPERAAKFIGGCALTFLGVYFITSGRTRIDDSDSESGEEEAIDLVNGERYRDSVDWQREGSQNHPEWTLDGVTGVAAQATDSRPGSLFSDENGDEEDGDGVRTPRAPLSSGPPSSVPSISSGECSLSPSGETSPQPVTENPWGSTPEGRGEVTVAVRPQALPQLHPTTQVLFQFPSAPGLVEFDISATQHQNRSHTPLPSTSPIPKTPTAAGRRLTFSRSPNMELRNSFSRHFAPRPLLAPLSGSLSAVVADSLLRGEGSPRSHRERTSSKKRKGKNRASVPFAIGESATSGHVQDENPLESEYETDTSNAGAEGDRLPCREHHQRFPLPDSNITDRAIAQEAVPTLDPSPLQKKKDSPRTRSLNDSLSGGLGWLNASIRGSPTKKKSKAGPSVTGSPGDDGGGNVRPSRS